MIIVDTELSGLDPEKDSLLSVGAVDLNNPKNQFYGECRIWNGAHINEDALKVNGFTKDEIQSQSKQSDESLIKLFIEWSAKCKEHTFAGQNPYMDMLFLRETAKRYHLNWTFAHRTFDQHTLCYMHMVKRGITPPVANKRTDINSDKVMEYVGIPTEPRPHNGLNGAKWSAEAISRLLYDKNLLSEFKKYPIPWLKAKKSQKTKPQKKVNYKQKTAK